MLKNSLDDPESEKDDNDDVVVVEEEKEEGSGRLFDFPMTSNRGGTGLAFGGALNGFLGGRDGGWGLFFGSSIFGSTFFLLL